MLMNYTPPTTFHRAHPMARSATLRSGLRQLKRREAPQRKRHREGSPAPTTSIFASAVLGIIIPYANDQMLPGLHPAPRQSLKAPIRNEQGDPGQEL
jgi:hypothetical protein